MPRSSPMNLKASVFVLTLFLGVTAHRSAAQSADAPLVRAVGTIAITVEDLDRSVAFFQNVLTFERSAENEFTGDTYDRLYGVFGVRLRTVDLRLGDERIQLRQFLTPRGRPMPDDSRSNDRWFQHIAIIVSDMEKAFAHLRAHKVEFASTGPQTLPTWNRSAAGIKAFYFRDPDGHFLEVLAFPPDKGAAKWHTPTDRLFLGIDHTAIVVSDTDTSLRLYRDTLGLQVVGESENYGVEQDHLNHVFGARLRITTLRAQAGPAIEFLEYITPRDGRPYPADSRPTDIWEWAIHLQVDDVASAANNLRRAGSSWVSSGDQSATVSETGYSRAHLTRDRDGHALLIHQPRH